MRQLYTLFLLAAVCTAQAQSITTTNANTFVPDLLTVEQGTDIGITVGAGHTMTEVSEATWNANGNTSNGGFNFSFGNHTLNLATPGTYYYVCQPHAIVGMKGRIIVEASTGVEETTESGVFHIFPNPASEGITITVGAQAGMLLRIIDAQGKEVLAKRLSGSDTIGISHLAKGNYTALLHDQQGSAVARRPLTITR